MLRMLGSPAVLPVAEALIALFDVVTTPLTISSVPPFTSTMTLAPVVTACTEVASLACRLP